MRDILPKGGRAPPAGGRAAALTAPSPDQVIVHGNAITEEAVFFHRASGVVLFTDLLQHYPRGWFKGWRALVAWLARMTAPEPEVPRKFRVAFTDRAKARAAIRRIQQWPAEKVLMAHGPVVAKDVPAFLKRAFRWLKP